MDRHRYLQALSAEKRFDTTKWVIDRIDSIIKPLVIYSVAMLAVECHMYPETDSHGSHWFFLWSERVVALILSIEYGFRWWRNSGKGHYPTTAFGIIDLMSILPFWIGFIPFLSPWLHLVRTLRVVRLLKFFRYNRSLQLVALGFYRAWFSLRPLLFMTSIIVLFTMFALYEVEGPSQEEFRDLFTLTWFLEVTATTVGYGDLSPQTAIGKIIVMAFMIAGLAVVMACFSAITNAFDQVFAEEADPDVDPFEEFKKVKKERAKIVEADKATGTTEAEDAAKEEVKELITDEQFLKDLEQLQEEESPEKDE